MGSGNRGLSRWAALNVSVFVSAVSGGWLFGHVDALATADVRVVIVCESKESHRPERRVHAPTGAPVWLLLRPGGGAPPRGLVADGQAWSIQDAIPASAGIGPRLLAHVAHHALPWLSTPIGALRRVIAAEGIDGLVCQEYEDARLDLCLLAAWRPNPPQRHLPGRHCLPDPP